MRQKTKINSSDKLQLLSTPDRSNTQKLRKEMYIINNINVIASFHIPFLKKRILCFQTTLPTLYDKKRRKCMLL